MNVLVTGATGFVGGHLVSHLLAGGHRVTALVRDEARGAPLVRQGVRVVTGTVDDRDALAVACDGADTIMHVAGLTRALNGREFHRVNVDGTRRLLETAAATRAARFMYVSSLAAAGPDDGRGERDASPRPVTVYGRSKLAAEQLVRASGADWTILRPPMVYGPGDRELLRVFRSARRFGIAPVFGDGTQQLVAIFAPDLAEALVVAATTDATVGGTYAVCHAERFTQRALAHAVGRAVERDVRTPGVPRWLARPILTVTDAAARVTRRPTLLTTDKANEFLASGWTADPAPFHRDTGWRAAHDLRAGLSLTATWYREHGWL
ncbi:MAG TPA: NAD(P)-dependent oxidoreductase [Gemmatimonadaceae bacterium]|nr:NAD(P)-dependent oxidoreductase [Gemmatimonadaceae bacterium]